jgi:pyrroline-5-carboxylate reductase
METIGIIGVGEISRAIVDGLCGEPDVAPAVLLSPRGVAVSADLARRYPSVRVCGSNQEVLDYAAVVILAVRPDALHNALDQLRISPGMVVISVVAGVEHDELHALFGPGITIVRAIPCRRYVAVTPSPSHIRPIRR